MADRVERMMVQHANVIVGPDHTVIDSDLGRAGNPLTIDDYVLVVDRLLEQAVSEQDIRNMICQNVVGLEERPQ